MNAFHLKCKVQNYDWGKIGENSKVAQLAKLNNPDIPLSSETPYAELWMGTHPNGESFIKSIDKPLSKWIKENCESSDGSLPFLFKVLSINKALSVQCHPNLEDAIALHALKPEIYKDPNHKPELAIALTEFQAMCGFRQYNEVQDFFNAIPELCHIIGDVNVANFTKSPNKDTLKNCFHSLMTADITIIENYLKKLQIHFKSLEQKCADKLHADLFFKLLEQFPNDVGVLCIYFLNILNLEPGQAIYLGPNVPHAYITGDCIECMACSDNVIRAGLTPKYKDVNTLIKLLDYKGYSIEELIFKPVKENNYVELFRPPVPDFAVAKVVIPQDQQEKLQCSYNTHSIIIVISGSAMSNIGLLSKGTIAFISKTEELLINKNNDAEFVMYQAMSAS